MIYLDLQVNSGSPSVEAGVASDQGAMDVGRVLIVDDDPMNIKLMGALLEADGHDVLFATNGRHGLELAETARPDLILLDYLMPGMDGMEVCQRLKQRPHLAEIPVVFVSARYGGSESARALSLGALAYITKPFSAEALRAQVRTCIRAKRSGAARAPELEG
jgi:CheY-like chemotaxis protein